MGLSLVLGLWDLPELGFPIPVRGEARMNMAQSGTMLTHSRLGELMGGDMGFLGDPGHVMQQATEISWPQVPEGKSLQVNCESEVPP